jgi:uncharacterized protein YceH (UPF0502 family)
VRPDAARGADGGRDTHAHGAFVSVFGVVVRRNDAGRFDDARAAARREIAATDGRKESRYAHLLGGEVQVAEAEDATPQVERATLEVRAESEKFARLEEELKSVRAELSELQEQFREFKKQFE